MPQFPCDCHDRALPMNKKKDDRGGLSLPSDRVFCSLHENDSIWQHDNKTLRGGKASRDGIEAERIAAQALEADGWQILGRRLRTSAGEIDILAERDGLLVVVEVKYRPTLSEAAHALGPRQRKRLIAAASYVLAQNPEYGTEGVRFDVIVVDMAGQVRRITDAFRLEEEGWP
ncbi:Endonuclease [Granulibacter bethesdensis]|nr:Endonuclease [Granulibacter bethesdensis]